MSENRPTERPLRELLAEAAPSASPKVRSWLAKLLAADGTEAEPEPVRVPVPARVPDWTPCETFSM